jgi:hypothetical protein
MAGDCRALLFLVMRSFETTENGSRWIEEKRFAKNPSTPEDPQPGVAGMAKPANMRMKRVCSGFCAQSS